MLATDCPGYQEWKVRISNRVTEGRRRLRLFRERATARKGQGAWTCRAPREFLQEASGRLTVAEEHLRVAEQHLAAGRYPLAEVDVWQAECNLGWAEGGMHAIERHTLPLIGRVTVVARETLAVVRAQMDVARQQLEAAASRGELIDARITDLERHARRLVEAEALLDQPCPVICLRLLAAVSRCLNRLVARQE
ncbi:MAG: hypothetical protein PHT12_00275 [Patescibacteria group bacterium]|nr:hypothetical protein [Patescibacteria group bacterium]